MSINVHDVALYGQNREPERVPSLSSGRVATFGWLDWIPAPGPHLADYAAKTVGLLIEQFRVGRPKITSLVYDVATFCQEIEDVLFNMLRFRAIGQAVGAQLDAIGNLVGIARTSNLDDIYRNDIYFQIYLNTSNGEPEALISALKRVTGAASIDYCEPSPAHVILTINLATKPIPDNVYAKMKALSAGGVQVDIQYNNATFDFVFNGEVLNSSAVSPYYTTESDPYFIGKGFDELFSDVPANTGGALTELIAP